MTDSKNKNKLDIPLFKKLQKNPLRPLSIDCTEAPAAFPACAAPDVRETPSFVVPFRRTVFTPWNDVAGGALPRFDLPPLAAEAIEEIELACARPASPNDIAVSFATSIAMNQKWSLLGVEIGDLSSTMGLAPLEELRLEFSTSQRKVMEQRTLDSKEEIETNESTIIDKEALNVTRASSRTEGWRVDGSGSISIGDAKLSASGGYSKTMMDSSNASLMQIHDATKKSSHTLKTMHKVEVRGVTESTVTNRMTRLIKNPYSDRTLAINVFQLNKRFCVETRVVEARPALVVRVKKLAFNDDFIIGQVGFLREHLLDSYLVDDLIKGLEAHELAATAFARRSQFDAATTAAKLALRWLFAEPNVFSLNDIDGVDQNLPATTFNGRLSESGFADLVSLSPLAFPLGMFFRIYEEYVANDTLDQHAVSLALSMAQHLAPQWAEISKDVNRQGQITALMDGGDFTEIFRRMPGFLGLVSDALGNPGGLLKPFGDVLAQQQMVSGQALTANLELEAARRALRRVRDHLNCNSLFYTQRFLFEISRKTNNLAIIAFVRDVLSKILSETSIVDFEEAFDVERAFVDRDEIIVPARAALTDEDDAGLLSAVFETPPNDRFRPQLIKPAIDQVRVPCDGIHLEVAAGLCPLNPPPPPPAVNERDNA
jgi:hypothetical protein